MCVIPLPFLETLCVITSRLIARFPALFRRYIFDFELKRVLKYGKR